MLREVGEDEGLIFKEEAPVSFGVVEELEGDQTRRGGLSTVDRARDMVREL